MARRYRGRARPNLQGRQRQSMVQLGMALAALVLLLVFWRQLSDGAAGCFYGLAGDPAQSEGSDKTEQGATEDQPIRVIGVPADAQ